MEGGYIPSGAIIAWSGAESKIPIGWALCNGANGTPDLRGRFLLGASVSHATGSKGGEETHTLTVGEMPAHAHDGTKSTEKTAYYGSNSFAEVVTSISNTSSATSKTGGDQAHNNMPPYYTICWIMKL